ncbi:hypothetical protein UFOVP1417_37 [uncultured Caudovirales phage]|uniref:Uncharacterized protein n=1 Tax=uncultured Caudovirales phage TaxID=2100421 RepID=A0A6J5NFP4_9CAUD|nr:hypothetical protein UFOVP664_50 [uncultured Caudovirales phage]CAB4195494.1 hypothetical protein UFOVP1303_17 [uncultured Caudovirales phage]CAB4210727.1 hypothetical protein UFOVP1417_37 [uncultured Caudovirales phage]CAB5226934.1 hypothetical protein UFOVP1517_74 [uncultured Caudovirales phage]
MTDDLVAQLREYGSCGMVFEAADRIEKLEAALRELSTDWDCCAVSKNMKLIARKALEGKDD